MLKLKKKDNFIITLIFIFLIISASIIITEVSYQEKDIYYVGENDTWHSEVIIKYTPAEVKNNPYKTTEYYYISYIGDQKIFEENKPLEYTWYVSEYHGYVTSKTYLNFTSTPPPSKPGKKIDSYPDKITLEIKVDGKTEIIYLNRK